MEKIVAAMDESKKELREIMRHCTELKLTAKNDRKMKQKDTDHQEDTISKYKWFWNNKLSDEKKRGFREVNIEELEAHVKSLKCRFAVDLLREAVDFRKKHKTWKFWECCDGGVKFGDYESYKEHIRILNKGLDKCTSSSVEDVDEKSVNMSSKIPVVDQALAFSDDIDRIQILEKIQGMFNLLLEKKCLSYSHVSFVIKYVKYKFETTDTLLKWLNLHNLQILCFLGASELRGVLGMLERVVETSGLSEVEIDKLSDDQVGGFKESVGLSIDLSSLLLDELEDDGSSESFAADSDDVVSWLHTGSDCEADLVSWRSLKHSQREQAKTFFRKFNEQLSLLLQYSIRNSEFLSNLEEIPKAENRICEEIMRETDAEHVLQVLVNVLEKQLKILEKMQDGSVRGKLSKAENVLEEAQGKLKIALGKTDGHLNGDQSGPEDLLKDDQSRLKEIKMAAGYCIKKESKKLDFFNSKDLALVDGVFLRNVGAFAQYELELANISVYDYRSIIVPMLKSFLQARLKALYEEDIDGKKREKKKTNKKNKNKKKN